MLLFDIETGPLPEDQIAHLKPEFEAPSNWKDPEKIAANIKAQEDKWLEKAALDPMTGRILCITTQRGWQEPMVETDPDERQMIANFWTRWEGIQPSSELAVGFYIFGFDLPFLLRRSWLLGVEVPAGILTTSQYNPDRLQWHRNFRCLMTQWKCGQKDSCGGLDGLLKAFGLEPKPFNGATFSEVWESDRQAAINYCQTEMRGMAELAKRMGLTDLPVATRNTEAVSWA